MAAPRGILALTGGVGGAKLALGLADALAGEELHLVVNTGDDFEHLGLHISPDIDTLLYTLSGRANAAQGCPHWSSAISVLGKIARMSARPRGSSLAAEGSICTSNNRFTSAARATRATGVAQLCPVIRARSSQPSGK